MRQNSIAKISGLSNISCHIFVGSILTLKDTARDPTVDLSRLNTIRRTIRKVMGVGKKQKTKNHGREVTEKKIVQRRKEGKNVLQGKLHCGANSLTHCIRLRGNLAATSYCRCNFLVLVEFPLTWFSRQVRKPTFFPFKAGLTMCAHTLSWMLIAKNRGRKTLMDNHC